VSTYIDPNTETWIEQLQARIAELETTLEQIRQHYEDVHAEEVNELNASIAELEKKSMQCPRCGDPITAELGDAPICGACALASELNAMTLQARITELEAENAIFRAADYEALQNDEVKPIYCAKCRDGIVADDDGICGVCAGAQDGVIESLQNKVAELKKSAIVWHKYPDEKPELNVKCLVMFDDGEPIIDSFDGFYWFDIEKTWVDRITHWAYLPEPPEVKE
jgi:ribosomal protein S27AE